MNTWQCLRQVQYLLRNQKWTGSSNLVFAEGSVKITAAPPQSVFEQLRMPAVMVRPLGATTDPEKGELPDLVEQEVAITLAVAHAGEAWGEYQIVGGHRAGQTESQGRGLLEVEEELFAAVELLDTDDGVVVQHRVSSAVQPERVGEQYLLMRDYLFRLRTSADRYYHPVENLVGSA